MGKTLDSISSVAGKVVEKVVGTVAPVTKALLKEPVNKAVDTFKHSKKPTVLDKVIEAGRSGMGVLQSTAKQATENQKAQQTGLSHAGITKEKLVEAINKSDTPTKKAVVEELARSNPEQLAEAISGLDGGKITNILNNITDPKTKDQILNDLANDPDKLAQVLNNPAIDEETLKEAVSKLTRTEFEKVVNQLNPDKQTQVKQITEPFKEAHKFEPINETARQEARGELDDYGRDSLNNISANDTSGLPKPTGRGEEAFKDDIKKYNITHDPDKSELLNEAIKYYGLHEDNPGDIFDSKTPWCSIFLQEVAKQAGIDVPGTTAMAKSWTNVGTKVPKEDLQYGDVVVFDRGGEKGHVGIYLGKQGGNIIVLGGNQSDQVKISTFTESSVEGGCRFENNTASTPS